MTKMASTSDIIMAWSYMIQWKIFDPRLRSGRSLYFLFYWGGCYSGSESLARQDTPPPCFFLTLIFRAVLFWRYNPRAVEWYVSYGAPKQSPKEAFKLESYSVRRTQCTLVNAPNTLCGHRVTSRLPTRFTPSLLWRVGLTGAAIQEHRFFW